MKVKNLVSGISALVAFGIFSSSACIAQSGGYSGEPITFENGRVTIGDSIDVGNGHVRVGNRAHSTVSHKEKVVTSVSNSEKVTTAADTAHSINTVQHDSVRSVAKSKVKNSGTVKGSTSVTAKHHVSSTTYARGSLERDTSGKTTVEEVTTARTNSRSTNSAGGISVQQNSVEVGDEISVDDRGVKVGDSISVDDNEVRVGNIRVRK